MREFFGLLLFIILLSIWSFVYADGKAKSSFFAINHATTIESPLDEHK